MNVLGKQVQLFTALDAQHQGCGSGAADS